MKTQKTQMGITITLQPQLHIRQMKLTLCTPF